MQNNLTQLLAALQQPEREQLLFFIQTAYDTPASTRENILQLTTYVFACLTAYEETVADEILWKQFWGKQKYDADALDDLKQQCLLAVREFQEWAWPPAQWLEGDLADTLSNFPPKERPALEKFLHEQAKTTPNFDAHISALIAWWFAQFDALLAELSEQKTHEALFPGQAEVKNRLGNLRHKALDLARKFVAVAAAGRDQTPLQELVNLQKFYNDRNLADKFQQARAQMADFSGQSGQALPQDYYSWFCSEREESIFQNVRAQSADDLNFRRLLETLHEYYLVESLWYALALLNQNQLAPLELPPLEQWLPVDLESPRLHAFFAKPLGELYAKAIRLASAGAHEDPGQLQAFIELLRQYEQQIHPHYLAAFEVVAINYCIRQTRKGNFEFRAFGFDIYQRMIASERIYVKGKIIASQFQAITALGLRLQEFDWVRRFLETHRERVSGAMSSLTYFYYNWADYLFHTGQFGAARDILQKANYTETQYKISAKVLEIKCLCEEVLAGDDSLDVLFDNRVGAAIVYFHRPSKITEEKKEMCQLFARTVKRIIGAMDRLDAAHLQTLHTDVSQAPRIAERQWLLKVIGDLQEKMGKQKKK